MARLELRLLGLFHVALDQQPINTFESNKVRALLGYLAVESHLPHRRESLAGLLWPDWPNTSAMSNLRYALADLRKTIGDQSAQPPFLSITRNSIQFNLDSDAWIDASEFTTLTSLPVTARIESAQIDGLNNVIGLYRGPFLEGFSLVDSPPFEQWVLQEREKLHRQMLQALSALADHYAQDGDYQKALSFAWRQVELEPWKEEAHQQVMRLLALSGQRSAALSQYEKCCRLLAAELGVKPGSATLELYEQIRDGKLATSRNTLISTTTDIPSLSIQENEPELPKSIPTPKNHLPIQQTNYNDQQKEIIQVQAGISGQSLRGYVPQSMAEVIEIAGQVCAVLEHEHAAGIFHRDLRLENIVVTPSKAVKLVDSDLGRSRDGASLMEAGVLPGSFLYMAPELLMGQTASVQSDLYALGVMLYELACGQPPFKGDDALTLISQHLHTTPIPPSTYNPAIPQWVETLILKLLSKQPGERPTSAAEVRVSLGQAVRVDASAVSMRTPLDRMVRGRLIGREQELGEVTQMWAKARQGESGIMLISGEPGVGKTRLVREMIVQVQMERGTPLVGECYAEGGAPYAAFAQMILNVPEWPGDLPQVVLADMISLAPGLRVHYANVPNNPGLEPMAEQQRLYESAFIFFARLARHSPLLLALEDMHWADGGTLALARMLARRFFQTQTPVLMVLTFREGELTEQKGFSDLLTNWNRERMANSLKLNRLDRQGTQAMLETLFSEAVTTDFSDGVYRETEGNPFFIEEMCKALIEGGQVYRENGRWQRSSSSAIEMPRSIRMAIETRLSGLPEITQEVLSLAAVLGRRFEYDVLQAATESTAGQDENALITALEEAEQAQLLYEVGHAGGGTFEFAHALIPTTLVAGISGLRRRRLHRRVLAAMEKLHPEDYRTLAHHCLEASEDQRALDFLLLAGQQARATFANAEAVANYQQAIGLLNELIRESLPRDDRQDIARRLHEDFGDVLELIGQHEQALTAYQNALGLTPASDPIRRSRLYRKASKTRENLRQYAEADQFYQQAETALGQEPAGNEVEWWQEWVALQLDRMSLYYWPGRVREMMELADKVRPAVDRYGTMLQRSNFYSNLVLAALRRDKYVISDEILNNARRAVSFIKDIGFGSEFNFQQFLLGFCLLWRGDLAEAESQLQFTLEVCERAGDVTVETRCLTYLTITFRKRGDLPRVTQYAARSLETAAIGQMIEYMGMAQANQAWVLRRESRLEEARRLVEDAWETIQKTIQSQMFAWVAVWPLLKISLEQKRVVDAVEYARLLLSPKTQPQPEAIAVNLQSAILAWEKGQPEQACAALTQAAGLAEPLGYI